MKLAMVAAKFTAEEANGLRRVRESRVSMLTTEDGLTDPVCLLAMQDSRRIWWVGGRNGDLARIENDRVSPVEFVTRAVTRPVSALFEDSTGRIWAATRDGTVFRWTGHIFEPFVEAGAGLSKVNAIAEDPRHGLWFAGFYGLSWWDGKSLHTPGAKDGVPEGEFTALAITADGTVWAGTRDGLVVRGGASGFRLLVLGNELGRRPVSCLRPAGPNEAWVSTLGAGLFHWDAKGWRHFGDEDGLPDGRLTWMVPAAGSEMWIGSMQGIIRVDTNRLLGSERPLSWLRLERADGLPTRECTGGAHPAGWRGADGELWFPTTQGVARIRPDQIHLESVPPPVLIESCRINGRNVPLESGQVEDGPGRCLIDLRFTALTYSAPEKVRFLVRLRGLDDRWQDPGGLRSASFASVPPGRYRFEVRAVNGDGVASAAPAALSILIRPHLWERPAFLVLLGSLVVLAATASGWAVARARMKRRLAVLRERQARETERARIARDLHDDLGADLTGIALMSDLAAEETPEAGKGPLREIAAKAREAVGALDEIVWAANPRHDSVASLVDYLSATSAERLSAAGIALRLDVPAHSDPVALAPESRHAVFLAVREALHNIVKHSGAREASLRIQQEQGWLEIAVTDKGRGFDLATVKEGDGLTNLHERMESCGGTCRLHSADGAGTQVVLRVPLLAVPRNPS